MITDTVFNLKEKDLLRKFKKYFFLNHKTEDQKWLVSKLLLKKSYLNLSKMQNKSEVRLIR